MPVVPMQRPISRGTPAGRAVLDRKTMHVHDLATELETEFPDSAQIQQVARTHTILATPLLREDVAVGAIVIRRAEVRPLDRKSTRLNSSHLGISYAVFCLKKKIINTII